MATRHEPIARRLTVLVVDDQTLVRQGIRRLLADSGDFEVVADVDADASALRIARTLRPDVALLGADGDGAGLVLIPGLRAHGARVVVLSSNDDADLVRQALAEGAEGFVVKAAAERELAEALRSAAAGRPYVHGLVAARLVAREVDGLDGALSDREREVLRLIALGHTNQAVGRRLHLSVRTIEAHRRNILQKLRLSTRADLVRYALDHRLIGSSTEL